MGAVAFGLNLRRNNQRTLYFVVIIRENKKVREKCSNSMAIHTNAKVGHVVRASNTYVGINTSWFFLISFILF